MPRSAGGDFDPGVSGSGRVVSRHRGLRDISYSALAWFIEGTTVEHDPEKWEPVFRKDHAQTKDEIMLRFNPIGS